MKKITAAGIILFIILTVFGSCKKDEPVTLESMKNALTDAGYIIDYDNSGIIRAFYEDSTDGFIFIYPGAHGEKMIPVIEYKDEKSAENFRKLVNESGGLQEAIINGKFVTIYDSDGHNHGNEKAFLEDLINGKALK
ncbi:MAG: hypothetical protein FWF92_02595 [Oscillospiraceae bacterium]|nr:hypothetical protein [Oscillospiraceae bacterium]